jgi:hypothetical protein
MSDKEDLAKYVSSAVRYIMDKQNGNPTKITDEEFVCAQIRVEAANILGLERYFQIVKEHGDDKEKLTETLKKYLSNKAFIVCSSDLFKEDRRRCSWGVAACGLFSDLEATYMEMCGDKRYSYDELELATENIDKIIVRMEKLKAFI